MKIKRVLIKLIIKMPIKEIKLKPHHICDFVIDYSRHYCSVDNPEVLKEYGEEFVRNLKRFYDELRGMKEGTLVVTNSLDSICEFCTVKKPHCSGLLNVDFYEGVLSLMRELRLQIGQRIPVSEFLKRILECSIMTRPATR